MIKRDELIKIFSSNIRTILLQSNIDFELLQEVRLRVNGPLILIYKGKEYFLSPSGVLSQLKSDAYYVEKSEIKETMDYISSYSLYAFEDEIKQGFITIQGGHRIGIAGKTVLDGDKITGLKYISYINVRISHEIKGCANAVMPFIEEENQVHHCLIISPPRCGKTTLLRDIIRQISNGVNGKIGKTVGVVDERSEIAGCYMGVAVNDLGIRTDVLDCCPKAKGMLMLIRSMSPSVIAVDEIGDYEDVKAIEAVIHCGCKLLATVHGSSIEDIKTKPLLQKMITEKVFERYIVLDNNKKVGNIREIFDERGTILYREEA
ncbi:MAG: stage III sporulation protein AA [Candidatus Galacturonibacter soehngenii]|nr:stage III sporulation protein AA [Candidatus Galacturonibacter soehngenii]